MLKKNITFTVLKRPLSKDKLCTCISKAYYFAFYVFLSR